MSSAASTSKTSTALRFFALTLLYPRALAVALTFTIVATAATVVGPRLLGYVIDVAILPRDARLLAQLVFLYFALEIVRAVATGFHSYYFQVLGQKLLQDLRVRVFDRILRLTVSHLDKTSSGALNTRLVNDIGALSVLFNAGFVRIIERVLTVAFIVASILALNIKLGLICLSLFALYMVFAAYISGSLYGAFQDVRIFLSDLNSFLVENVGGIKTIHLFNRERRQSELFSALSTRLANARLRPSLIFASLHCAMTLVVGLSMLTLILLGGRMVEQGEIQVGVLVALISYVLWLFWPIMQIVNEWNSFLGGMAAAERIFEIFEWPTEPVEAERASDARQRLKGSVRFENVWFGYDPLQPVLKGISFEVQAGQKVAICGPTGSGKSTMLSLLQRFYEIDRGQILIDGNSVRNLERSYLRSRLGVVQQDVFLFSGSVSDNVTLWNPQLSFPRSDALLSQLSTKQFEPSSLLAERGANLSMGERQYLAFLRTLAKAPDIWLVDEATSYLDPTLDKSLMMELQRAAQDRTVITVAHRLTSITNSDLILVLHEGEIVERGRHEELLKLDGLYAKMYRLQAALSETKAEQPTSYV
ncbi:MAG: ABC transporter ATP-binding protein [Deltaproteobacteria bacterium]|nr:ABC transporter ATP-binding protein [Deltaproteobacteria bacterium]